MTEYEKLVSRVQRAIEGQGIGPIAQRMLPFVEGEREKLFVNLASDGQIHYWREVMMPSLIEDEVGRYYSDGVRPSEHEATPAKLLAYVCRQAAHRAGCKASPFMEWVYGREETGVTCELHKKIDREEPVYERAAEARIKEVLGEE